MNIQENISLSQYTTLKVGGPAKFFAEAKNEKEILEAVKFAREKKLPVFLLGGGSNILVSDKGFEGLVIKIHNTLYKIRDTSIECGAGCQLGKIVNESVKSGLAGLEWAAGIPGTVGGAIRGNAGAFGGEMAEIVDNVKVLSTNKGSTFPLSDKSSNSSRLNLEFQVSSFKFQDCQFSYRDSIFKQNPNLVILSATLKLERGNREENERKMKEIIAQRKAAQPANFPSSGSFFKNPVVKDRKLIEEYQAETGNKPKGNEVPAGYIIDALDLRGKKIGGAMVSREHGNFLVNAGGAKAEDFVILAALVKSRARNKFGVQLQEEVQMVGF